jgi:hypothetical protein
MPDPVADVFENELSQHHLRRRTTPPAAVAVGMSLAERFIHRRDDGIDLTNFAPESKLTG